MAKYQKYTCIDAAERLVDYLYTPNQQKIDGISHPINTYPLGTWASSEY